MKKSKSQGFDICEQPSYLELDSNRRFVSLCDLEIWWMTLKKISGTSSILCEALCIISNPSVNSNLSYSPETLSLGRKWWYFVSCDLKIQWMTLKKTIGHLFCTTLSFVHYIKAMGELKLELQSGNAQFRSKSSIFCPMWPWNLTDDLEKQYAASNFVHHFIAMGEFKLELQSGNAQFGSKLAIFLSCVTLKFDRWPWKTIGHLSYAASSSVHHFIAIGEFKLELQSGNTKFGSKSTNFLVAWPWNLTDDLEKQYGTYSKQHQAWCIISSPYVNLNWSYSPETAKWGHDLCDLDLWPWLKQFQCLSLGMTT